MKIWKVVGIRNVDYVSRKTGRQVQGCELHLAREADNSDHQGLEVRPEYISRRILNRIKEESGFQPHMNGFIQFVYDERGDIYDIIPKDAVS